MVDRVLDTPIGWWIAYSRLIVFTSIIFKSMFKNEQSVK